MKRWSLGLSGIRQLTVQAAESFSPRTNASIQKRKGPTDARGIREQIRRNDFASLKLHQKIISALEASDIQTPTEIQRAAAAPILSGRHTLIAAETGAGKTVAYLGPLLSLLKEKEGEVGEIQLVQTKMRPQIIVLAPTRELVTQIIGVGKGLGHVGKFRVRAGMGGGRMKKKKWVDTGVDLLVGTARGVLEMRDKGLVYFSRVSGVVVDEADVMLSRDGGFREDVLRVFRGFGQGREDVQGIFVAGNVGGGLEGDLQKEFRMKGGLVVAKGSKLHKVAGKDIVDSIFLKIAGGDDEKMRRAVWVIEKGLRELKGTEKERIMVFCEQSKRREELVELVMKRTGAEAVHLWGGVSGGISERREGWERFIEGEAKVGICAKSFGRGLDDRGIGMIVLVDVPMTGVEYLHRVGRLRDEGKVVVLVGKKEIAVAQELFLRVLNGENVASVGPKIAWKHYTLAGRDRVSQFRRGRVRWINVE